MSFRFSHIPEYLIKYTNEYDGNPTTVFYTHLCMDVIKCGAYNVTE